jgi:hypothetical protein
MKRRLLMFVLFLGTVGGYGAGFHSLYRHHHGHAHACGWSR